MALNPIGQTLTSDIIVCDWLAIILLVSETKKIWIPKANFLLQVPPINPESIGQSSEASLKVRQVEAKASPWGSSSPPAAKRVPPPTVDTISITIPTIPQMAGDL
ncbi:hypothetical protein TSMEX_001065 [Taenia solium]|eukprot:TsM_000980500 transcript=TsM_000980500 gene=TsM_000980500